MIFITTIMIILFHEINKVILLLDKFIILTVYTINSIIIVTYFRNVNKNLKQKNIFILKYKHIFLQKVREKLLFKVTF